MDRTRVKADSENSYRHYLELLHSKIQQYDVEPRHIYNMDKKGFLAGVTSRQKRIFSRQLWEQKKVTTGLQDGSQEWTTILALVCADGSSLDPSVIFEAKGGLRTGWVHDVEPEKHQVFFTTSPSGWSNDDVGLAWLEQVFDRRIKDKTRLSYRILIVDGHGSHLTRKFLQYCLTHKILLCILPPHSTHSLQPLDVVLFGPLSRAYTVKLADYLQRSKGLLPVKKADFFLLFWDAYNTSFTRENVLKSFEATGVEPRDASVVLQRFTTPLPQLDDGTKLGEHGDGDTWRDVRNLFDAAVPDKMTVEAKRLSEALHSFQVKNKVVWEENKDLRTSLNTKKKRAKKSKHLHLSQQKEFHSNAVFYSPGTICEGFELEDQKEHKKEAEQLQKKHQKELQKAHNTYQKQIAAEKREQRKRDSEAKKKEKDARVAERLAAKERKQQERNAATTQKSHNTANKASRTTSQGAVKKTQQGGRAAGVAEGEAAVPLPLPPPPKLTTCGRQIKVPKKFE
jgi:hypothetical protein